MQYLLTEEEKNKLETKSFEHAYMQMLTEIGEALRESHIALPPRVVLAISKAYDKAIETIRKPNPIQSTH